MNLPRHLLLLLALSLVSSEEKKRTSNFKLDSGCYQLIHLFEQKNIFDEFAVTKIRVLHSDNTVYYAFKARYSDDKYNNIGHVNLESLEKEGFITYDDNDAITLNSFTFDIDQQQSVVYIGSKTGIYTYDEFGILKPYGATDDKITNLCLADSVYIVKGGEGNIYKLVDGRYEVVVKNQFVKDFFVLNNGFILFLNEEGLFLFDGEKTNYVSGLALKGFAIDLYEEVYLWHNNEIYRFVIDSGLTFRVVNVGHLSVDLRIDAMTFDDKNNIIFMQGTKFYMLMLVPCDV